jgi:hypothetical protein
LTDPEADDTNIDPTLQIDGLTQPYRIVFEHDPPPLAPGYNYEPEVRAEEHARLFLGLPPGFNTPGISVRQDGMAKDIQEEIDHLTTQRLMTPVPLPAEPTGGANGTNTHPTDANGRPRHGGCGSHGCSVCGKSFCKKNVLKWVKRITTRMS